MRGSDTLWNAQMLLITPIVLLKTRQFRSVGQHMFAQNYHRISCAMQIICDGNFRWRIEVQ